MDFHAYRSNKRTYRELRQLSDEICKEHVIFEAAWSTLLAMQGDEKLPNLKTLQAEQQRLLEEQQRLYDERARLKKEARMIDTLKANVDDFLKSATSRDQEKDWTAHLE